MAAHSVASAFDGHQFVFLGSTHGSRKVHDFLMCLLSRPAFHRRATDVLVEFASPVHQSVLDRSLPQARERPSRIGATGLVRHRPAGALGPPAPDPGILHRRAGDQREAASREPDSYPGRIEPVDWATVRSAEDLAAYPFKTNYAAHVIAEHFAPVRRDVFLKDPQRMLQLRLGKKAVWFRTHPNDVPPRP